MRTVNVSTDVYSSIWANRNEGEETEDDILRRILGCPKAPLNDTKKDTPQGVYDARNKVTFVEGFEVYRHYKGVEYRAVATNGRWHLKNTGKNFISLNQLTKAVSNGSANAWVTWNFIDSNGDERKIAAMRRESAIFVPTSMRGQS